MQTSNEIYNVSSGTKLKCGSVFCSIYHYNRDTCWGGAYRRGNNSGITDSPVDFNVGQTSLPQTLCIRPTSFEISESLRYGSLST